VTLRHWKKNRFVNYYELTEEGKLEARLWKVETEAYLIGMRALGYAA